MIVNKEEMMLTTVDNPFDPFEQFDQWFMFDVSRGYNTNALVDRIVSARSKENISIHATDNDYKEAYMTVVDLYPGLYRVVHRTIEIDNIYLV